MLWCFEKLVIDLIGKVRQGTLSGMVSLKKHKHEHEPGSTKTKKTSESRRVT